MSCSFFLWRYLWLVSYPRSASATGVWPRYSPISEIHIPAQGQHLRSSQIDQLVIYKFTAQPNKTTISSTALGIDRSFLWEICRAEGYLKISVSACCGSDFCWVTRSSLIPSRFPKEDRLTHHVRGWCETMSRPWYLLGPIWPCSRNPWIGWWNFGVMQPLTLPPTTPPIHISPTPPSRFL